MIKEANKVMEPIPVAVTGLAELAPRHLPSWLITDVRQNMKTLAIATVALAVLGCSRPNGLTVSARHVDLLTSPDSSFGYSETTIVDRYPNEAIYKLLASKYIISKIVQDPNFGRHIRTERILKVLNLTPATPNPQLIDSLFAAKKVTWADEKEGLVYIRFKDMPFEVERKLCDLHVAALGRLLKEATEPNKAVEPTPVAVTDRADARSAPSTSAAHF